MNPLVGLSGFGTIVADPPWEVKQPPKKWTGKGNSPFDYPTMAVQEIAALPVAGCTADYCHLYLWTVNKHIESAYDVCREWGFRPTMLLTWCKAPLGDGPGWEFSSCTEFVLFGKRGTGVWPRPKHVSRNWFDWPRGRHSQKPEAFQDMVESVSPGPRLELFARRLRLGWTVWGNEVEANSPISINNPT